MRVATTTRPFFDSTTWTVSYVVSDNATRAAAVIDPVLDYDFRSGHTSTRSADKVIEYVVTAGLSVQWILDSSTSNAPSFPTAASSTTSSETARPS